MTAKKYQTIAEINRIVADDLREGVSLEYKSSTILDSKGVGAICKAVSALSNSAGGQFITGVESKDGKPVRLDGGFSGPSKLDWLHQIINANTHPALENFDVTEISDRGGLYYVIDVPVSAKAPHQSNDNKYYKRRGPHTDPMEHYEIEDIRNRPKIDNAPLRAEIASDGFLALLRFSNDASDPITNLKLEISANFNLKPDSIKTLNSRGLKRIAPNGELSFFLDSFATILHSNLEAEISIGAQYEFKGALVRHSDKLCVGDFSGSAIVSSPLIKAVNGVSDKIDKLTDSLKPIRELLDIFERAVDGSGVRISKRTLSALKGELELFDPTEFDYRGYQIIAGLSQEEALSLQSVFGLFGYPDLKRQRYAELSEEVRAKFERVFKVEFE